MVICKMCKQEIKEHGKHGKMICKKCSESIELYNIVVNNPPTRLKYIRKSF